MDRRSVAFENALNIYDVPCIVLLISGANPVSAAVAIRLPDNIVKVSILEFD